MIETLIGGALGGLARLAPEVLNFLDRDKAREHELAVLNMNVESTKINALKDVSNSAITGFAATVRPVITYWFMAIYFLVKVASFWAFYEANASFTGAILGSWDESDKMLFAMILNFWFLGRVFEKKA